MHQFLRDLGAPEGATHYRWDNQNIAGWYRKTAEGWSTWVWPIGWQALQKVMTEELRPLPERQTLEVQELVARVDYILEVLERSLITEDTGAFVPSWVKGQVMHEHFVAGMRMASSKLADKLADVRKWVPELVPLSHDEECCVRFSQTMMQRMAEKAAQGRRGWDDKGPSGATQKILSEMLHAKVRKGHLVDIAVSAMMLFMRDEGLLPEVKDDESNR